MEIGYIVVFGWPKKPSNKVENLRSQFNSFKEACKKHKLTLVFYGGPFGVQEPLMFVLKGKVTDWEKALPEEDFSSQAPLERTRTVLVWDYE